MAGKNRRNQNKKNAEKVAEPAPLAAASAPTSTSSPARKKKPGNKQSLTQVQLDKLLMKNSASDTDVVLRSMTSGVGSTKEVYMQVTDYFDHGAAATPYWFWSYETSQEVFQSGTASTDPFVKLIEAKVFALPKFALDTATSSVLCLTTVPSFAGSQESDGVAANPQTTLLTPSSNSQWRCVGSYKAKDLFSGGVQPQVTTSGNQVVFAGTQLDPDSMERPTEDILVQYKIVCRFAVGLDPITRFKYAFSENDVASTLAFPVQVATTAQPCVMQVTGMGNIG